MILSPQVGFYVYPTKSESLASTPKLLVYCACFLALAMKDHQEAQVLRVKELRFGSDMF